MGINSGKFTAPSFGSAPAWCQYEHESTKIVALTHKVSPFTGIPSGFGPVVGLWLDYPLYLLMGNKRLKMVAPFLENVYSGSVYPFFHPWHGHTAPISTNAQQVGKSLRLPQNIFLGRSPATGRGPFRSVTSWALKSPNAHRLGKIEHLGRRKLFAMTPLAAVVPSSTGPTTFHIST